MDFGTQNLSDVRNLTAMYASRTHVHASFAICARAGRNINLTRAVELRFLQCANSQQVTEYA
jgi:hypothetical protein